MWPLPRRSVEGLVVTTSKLRRDRTAVRIALGFALCSLFLFFGSPAEAALPTDCDIPIGVSIDVTDYIDPTTGEFDETGYLIDLSAISSSFEASAGDSLVVCVEGFAIGSHITVVLDGSVVLFSGTYNGDIQSIPITLPSNLSCGPHTLTASGVDPAGDAVSFTSTFEVTTCPGGTNLPTTGAESGKLVGIGAALVVLGAGVYYGARQRRAGLV